MKTKITLSVNKRTVALLRKAGARKAKPMSAIIDDLVEDMDRKEAATGDNMEWLDEMGTWLSGKFSEKDFQEDPRLAYSFGYKPKATKARAKR